MGPGSNVLDNIRWLTGICGYEQESIFLVEARDSQRDIMELAVIEDPPPSSSSSSSHTGSQPPTRAYLDLSVRQKIQLSTATSLESLATNTDLRDELTDNNLKRSRDIITNIEKESQVKEQRNSFRGIFPCGDSSKETKKSRND